MISVARLEKNNDIVSARITKQRVQSASHCAPRG
jgi:hypothetical protein